MINGPGLSSHRYSVIFSADLEIFAFSAMFRAVPADFSFDISGHNWFSDEHFWTSLIQRWALLASSKPTKTIKTAKKGVFYYRWWKDEKSKTSEWISIGFFLKNSKNTIFWKSVFPFVFMSYNFLPEQKTAENTKINPANRRKTLQEDCDVFRVFLGQPFNFLRQQCSWLNQRKSVMFKVESVFFRNDRRENQLFRADSALFISHQNLFNGAE